MEAYLILAKELFLFFLGTFVSLFAVVNPMLAAPVFVTLTQGEPASVKQETAQRASVYVFWVLITFLITGSLILSFFGISISALRIAGGLMILATAYAMLNKKGRLLPEEQMEAEEKEDIAFSPMAMPLMSGPGSIAVIIGMTADAITWAHYGVIIAVIGLVALCCYLVMLVSEGILKRMGSTLVNAFTRIMGFILLCVAIQFIVNGIEPILVGVLHNK